MSMRLDLTLIAAAAIALPAAIAVAGSQPASGKILPAPAAPAPRSIGEATFLAKCRYCHIEMGPGTLTLERRVGKEHAKLATRTDLQADYVKAVVRGGLNTMPPINRVEVSDKELDTIANWLATHNGKK